MAAVQGLKRSYHEMRHPELAARVQSLTQTPLGSQSPTLSEFPNAHSTANGQVSKALQTRKAAFEPRASIVLIGTRGVGKSTLAVLAATAYNLKPLEADKQFLDETATTVSAYRKQHGVEAFRQRHRDVLETTLARQIGAVIVCSLSDLDGDGAALIRDYAQQHPVIHISRDAEGIQSHLGVWTTDQVKKLLSASEMLLRSCSNFEFFNLTETTATDEQHSRQKFLTLKRVERDFLRLLRNIIGDYDRGPSHQSAYPLSQIWIQDRPYTFAVAVHLSDIMNDCLNLDKVQIGADCVQLVIDANQFRSPADLSDIARAFAIVRRASILPVWLDFEMRRASSRADACDVSQYCLRLGPEFCTIDLSLPDNLLRHIVTTKGGTRLIGTSNCFDRPSRGWNDSSCLESYRRATEIGFDVVRITMAATSIDEAFDISAFRLSVAALGMLPKLIAYNTGTGTQTSKCFNRVLTPVKSMDVPADAELESYNDDGTITAKDVTNSLFATFVLRPKRFFIFGADVSYSLSPAMHNAAYEACGLRFTYDAHSSADPDDFDKLVNSPGFGGTAVTQPFKTRLVSRMDGLSRHAKAIGAVNTIVPVYELLTGGGVPEEIAIIAQRNMHGKSQALFGYNTDWIGIRSCIRRGLSPANAIRPGSSALVCGAGGMARAAIYTLLSLGVRNVVLCNRTYQHATDLAEHYRKLIAAGEIADLVSSSADSVRLEVLESFDSPWPHNVRQPTMIVCCVPRRTADGTPTNFALPDAWLGSANGGVCVEVAYREPISPLVKQMRDRVHAGWIFMDGFDVLPEQAFSQFEIFTGRRAPRKLMKDEVMKHYPVS